MKRLLVLLFVAPLAACNHPSPTCEPNQTDCVTTSGTASGSTASAATAAATSGATTGAAAGVTTGATAGATTGAATGATGGGMTGGSNGNGTTSGASCTQPDFYAACFMGGGVVGLCSATGAAVETAVVAAPPPGGGAPVIGELQSLVFTSATTLWALDVDNAQIDVLDISSWPPTNVMSIAAGTTSYDPIMMTSCGSQVLLLRSEPPLLEAFNGATGAFVNEVSLAFDGGSPDPYDVVCNGTTAYVADPHDEAVFAIDLTSFTISSILYLPASDEVAPAAAAGGVFEPSLAPLAIATPSGGTPQLFMGLQNYADFGTGSAEYTQSVEDSMVLVSAAAQFPSVSSPTSLGQCDDVWSLATAADQSTIYASCGGSFAQPNTSGQVGVLSVNGPAAGQPITVPLSNPGAMAFLGNGLLAVADTSSTSVVLYDPADGGVTALMASCPEMPDGGLNLYQFISAIAPAP